jgi:methylated-DNA-[protein]-cysteine S-methyltransferase
VRFAERVWSLLKYIPKGRITTYKIIAQQLHSKGYRPVGNACHRNPNPITVPCHRVICSDGSLGGFAGGDKKKIALLKREGVMVTNNIIRNWKRILFRF